MSLKKFFKGVKNFFGVDLDGLKREKKTYKKDDPEFLNF